MKPLGSHQRRRIEAVAARLSEAVTPGCFDIGGYLSAQVGDESHREVIGPLLQPSGASGVVRVHGERVASWGDPTQPEMLFSATKTFVSLVAGVAFEDRLLEPQRRVVDDVPLAHLLSGRWSDVTWEHLLQQTSMWDGELWGKPARVDAQSGGADPQTAPGTAWAYNDVRVNLLCLALTLLWGRPLDVVLAERVTGPAGASSDWSWNGYENSTVDVDGEAVPVVVGGGHWGGGLFMSADDMAAVGAALLGDGGSPASPEWLSRSWTPCGHTPSYGYLWWLNDDRTVVAGAPASGRCARGNLGRHLLWVDRARELVIASHWTEGIGAAVAEISAAVGGS